MIKMLFAQLLVIAVGFLFYIGYLGLKKLYSSTSAYLLSRRLRGAGEESKKSY